MNNDPKRPLTDEQRRRQRENAILKMIVLAVAGLMFLILLKMGVLRRMDF